MNARTTRLPLLSLAFALAAQSIGCSDEGGASTRAAPPDDAVTSAGDASPGAAGDAGADARGTVGDGGDGGGNDPEAGDSGAKPPAPAFACWGNGKPDPAAVVHAGFQWFESGYPGTLSASDNATLAKGGVVPIAYINMSEVPNDDTYLQGQIGSFWTSIKLCQNSQWNTTVVDVRDSRWQDWLVRRANAAYALGNRGIKWDVAGVESLCKSWSGDSSAAQQAVDAMVSVLSTLKTQHPDFRFILNQGFAIASQHPGSIDGFEEENLMNYVNANPGDAWAKEQVDALDAIHARGIPIFDLEYIDLFGCKDTSCAAATRLIGEVAARGWVPYVTDVSMSIEGRGLHIAPPW